VSPPEFTVRLLPVAEDDLDEILAFIAADNLTAALNLADRIEKQLAELSNFPNLGRIPQESDLARAGYRYLITKDYLVFYTIEKRTVFVHRILHGARDYIGLL
jgi:plasmid stabilization system protein ParE